MVIAVSCVAGVAVVSKFMAFTTLDLRARTLLIARSEPYGLSQLCALTFMAPITCSNLSRERYVSMATTRSVLHEGRRLRREELSMLLSLHGVVCLQQLRRQLQQVGGEDECVWHSGTEGRGCGYRWFDFT